MSENQQNILQESNQNQQEEQKQISDDKKHYKGSFLDNKKNGFGTEVDRQNDTEYVGSWKNNVYDGEGVLYSYKDKCFFKGIWKQNEKVEGIEIFPNGDQYEGQYQDKKFHGKGVLFNRTMKFKYDGEFKNGQRHGQGCEYYEKKNVFYQGEFKNNQKHGKGILKFADQSRYEGDFLKGLPNGFGVFTANSKERSQSLVSRTQANISNNDGIVKEQVQNEVTTNKLVPSPSNKNNNDTANTNFNEMLQQNLIQNNLNDQSENEGQYYYEGEFVDGYKHGIGRQFDPSGSYLYSRWEFDRQIGTILYYNSQNHKWTLYKYKKSVQPKENYIFIDEQQKKEIVEILDSGDGYPPNKYDAYKKDIDRAGIENMNFIDEDFSFTDSKIFNNQNLEFSRVNFEFLKNIRKDYTSKYSKTVSQQEINIDEYVIKYELFEEPIEPFKLEYSELSDYQLASVLESLMYAPYLLKRVFTPKFEIEYIGFFTLQLYINGNWEEIIVDNQIVVYKSKQQPIFSNTKYQEIGWMILQKAFCKLNRSYFYFQQDKTTRFVGDYMQMLTGKPCKNFTWKPSEDNEAGDNEVAAKISKLLQLQLESAKLCYLRPERVQILNNKQTDNSTNQQSAQLQPNDPFIILGFIEKQNTSNRNSPSIVLVYALNPLKSLSQLEVEKSQLQAIDIAEQLQKKNFSIETNRVIAITLSKFINNFNEISMLSEENQLINNQCSVEVKIQEENEFAQSDNKFFLDFALTLPRKIMFNVNQTFQLQGQANAQEQSNQKQDLEKKKKNQTENEENDKNMYLPVRIVLGKRVDINPKQFLSQQQPFSNKSQQTKPSQNSYQQTQLSQAQLNEKVTNSLGQYPSNKSNNEQDQQKDMQSQIVDIKVQNQNQSQNPQEQLKPNNPQIPANLQGTNLKGQNDTQILENQKDKSIKKGAEQAQNKIPNKDQKNKELVYDDIAQSSMQYIFGKGQYKQKNLFKTVNLQTGVYRLLIQIEGPDLSKGKLKYSHIKNTVLEFTINLFSDTLIRLYPVEKDEDFVNSIYRSCILQQIVIHNNKSSSENLSQSQQEHQGKNIFRRTDLSQSEKGSQDLIITQYFLKNEGTYLQYFENKSQGDTSKKWRQKLYFRTSNMKILGQIDAHKVEVNLENGKKELIIIQQTGGFPYLLEGGEGICIIENKNKPQEVQEQNQDINQERDKTNNKLQ